MATAAENGSLNLNAFRISAAVLALSLTSVTNTKAGVVFNSGPSNGLTNSFCDDITLDCGDNQPDDPSTGWIIYSDFSLTSKVTVTGASYGTYFPISSAEYVETVWSIWSSNPRYNFATGPAYVGTAVGLASDSPNPGGFGLTTTVIFTGLNIPLPAGDYWIGLENVTDDGLYSFYAETDRPRHFSNQSNQLGTFYNVDLEPAAFTIEGVPEPATWPLMIVGVGGVGAGLRRRRGPSSGGLCPL